MKERAIRIGRPSPLVGVICEPETVNSHLPAVLIFNSGVMHHIGSCRLSVKLARCFSESGILSIRFDFSGVGDSGSRRGGGSFSTTAAKEAKEIMDYLEQKRGIKQFILYGLCSGADAAYETALVDDRVVAYSQIDAYCYKTPKFYYHKYRPKVFDLDRWLRFFRRIPTKIPFFGLAQGVKAEKEGSEYLEAATYVRKFPHRNEVKKGLQSLMSRGVYLNIIFTGSEYDYSYVNQYRESFKSIDFGSYLDVHYFSQATHIITHPDHQVLAVNTIAEWLFTVVNRLQQKSIDK